MKRTDASSVIKALDGMFVRLGFPSRMITDNGPPFNSSDFEEYCEASGINLRHSIPFQPRINGEVEIQNKSLVKAIIISVNSGGDWKEDLKKYLFMHRTTPHSVTGVAPLELFLKRKIRDKLPTIADLSTPYETDEAARDRDAAAKERGKTYADKRFHHKKSDLPIGSKVLQKRFNRTSKWQSRNDPRPLTVVAKRGPAVTVVAADGATYVRDVSQLVRLSDECYEEAQSAPDDAEGMSDTEEAHGGEEEAVEAEMVVEAEMADQPAEEHVQIDEPQDEPPQDNPSQPGSFGGFAPTVSSTPVAPTRTRSDRPRRRPERLNDYTT